MCVRMQYRYTTCITLTYPKQVLLAMGHPEEARRARMRAAQLGNLQAKAELVTEERDVLRVDSQLAVHARQRHHVDVVRKDISFRCHDLEFQCVGHASRRFTPHVSRFTPTARIVPGAVGIVNICPNFP